MAQDDLRVIVIGFNDSAGADDAVGGVVVAELKKVAGVGCELRTIEGDWPSGLLTEAPADALVIFLDAVHSNSTPGTIHCLKWPSKSVHPRHLRPQVRPETEGKGIASRLFLVGIEAASGGSPGELSEPVRKAVSEIVRNFPRYLKLARDLTA